MEDTFFGWSAAISMMGTLSKKYGMPSLREGIEA